MLYSSFNTELQIAHLMTSFQNMAAISIAQIVFMFATVFPSINQDHPE